MHGHQVLVVFTNLFTFRLIACLKYQLLQKLTKPNTVGVVFGSKDVLEGLIVCHIAARECFFYFFKHELFGLYVGESTFWQLSLNYSSCPQILVFKSVMVLVMDLSISSSSFSKRDIYALTTLSYIFRLDYLLTRQSCISASRERPRMEKLIFCSYISQAISTMYVFISCLQYCFLSRQLEQDRRSLHWGCLQKYSSVLEGCFGQLTR